MEMKTNICLFLCSILQSWSKHRAMLFHRISFFCFFVFWKRLGLLIIKKYLWPNIDLESFRGSVCKIPSEYVTRTIYYEIKLSYLNPWRWKPTFVYFCVVFSCLGLNIEQCSLIGLVFNFFFFKCLGLLIIKKYLWPNIDLASFCGSICKIRKFEELTISKMTKH